MSSWQSIALCKKFFHIYVLNIDLSRLHSWLKFYLKQEMNGMMFFNIFITFIQWTLYQKSFKYLSMLFSSANFEIKKFVLLHTIGWKSAEIRGLTKHFFFSHQDLITKIAIVENFKTIIQNTIFFNFYVCNILQACV